MLRALCKSFPVANQLWGRRATADRADRSAVPGELRLAHPLITNPGRGHVFVWKYILKIKRTAHDDDLKSVVLLYLRDYSL